MPILPTLLALAAATSTPHLSATRVEKGPVLDGKLDDAAWRGTPLSDGFTQKLPEGGKPPGETTTVRVLYDKDNLYVGIDCPQKKSEVVGRLTRRDRNVEADAVYLVLDSRGDGKTAFEFGVNVSGVQYDGLHFNDTDYSQDWDENWEAKTARTASGWSAELRIPLRILRFGSRPVQSWGLQVKRYVSQTQELDEWAYIPRDAAGEVSHYGKLDNLVGLKPEAGLELRPFVVGSIRHHFHDVSEDVLANGFEPGISAGLDLKWHISQELTLDATFLPDFGQVEADQVVLNLTTFEQYYPEKRPFFLEGVETFNTPFQLLYTRRIGRAPDAPALVTDSPIGEKLVHDPKPSTIYGAAKLVGELGNHLSVGELVAITGRQTVEAQSQNGTHVDRLADPLTTYKVLRLKREIGDNSHVGLIAIATNRVESGGDYPILPGAGSNGRPAQLCPSEDVLALGQRCFHDAYVGGVDARWRSASGDYTASGQAIATLIKNGPARTLADGTVVKSGDVGPALQATVAKEGGKFTWRATYEGLGKKTDYNDLGYMQRQNQHRVYLGVEYRTVEPWRATTETHTGLEYRERDNLEGLALDRWLGPYNFTRFKNFWGEFTGVHWRPRRFDDREMGDGAALERAGLWGIEGYFFSDSRKVVNGELWTQVDFIAGGGYTIQGDGRLSVRVLPQWDVDLLPTWIYTRGEQRYFGTSDDGQNYLFGAQRAQSLGLTLRSTYTFTPRLTLQAYGQLFFEAEHYDDFKRWPSAGLGQIIRLGDLLPAGVPSENPDFSGTTFNGSLVLRWEYRLGSTAYLVYSHSQDRSLTPNFGDRTGFEFRLLGRPHIAEDALLLKLSYWWG